MLLVMNANNSRTAVGLFDGDELRSDWYAVTTNRTGDELHLLVATFLRHEGIDPRQVTGCCIASVVPHLSMALYDMSREGFGVEPVMVGPGVRTGLVLQVDNPKEVGADRIVNAVAAIEEHKGPLIIVDFGTATTFDAITANAEYRGGVIVPGVQVSADALFERCAKLPRVEIVAPPNVIGKDTVTHIRSGLTYGYADLVDGLITRIAQEMGASPKVVATGGFAPLIGAIARKIDVIDPLLALKGLKAVFKRNQRTVL